MTRPSDPRWKVASSLKSDLLDIVIELTDGKRGFWRPDDIVYQAYIRYRKELVRKLMAPFEREYAQIHKELLSDATALQIEDEQKDRKRR